MLEATRSKDLISTKRPTQQADTVIIHVHASSQSPKSMKQTLIECKDINNLFIIVGNVSWAQWLTLTIPELWEAEEGRSHEAGSLRPAWTTWWNPFSTKNTRTSPVWLGGGVPGNPSYSRDWGRRIAWPQEAEVAVSWDWTTELQPGQQRETLSQK